MDKRAVIMIAYAMATERDAIGMYKYMIRNLPEEYREALVHILKEERDHYVMLKRMLKQ